MTRAKERLLITASGRNGFTEKLTSMTGTVCAVAQPNLYLSQGFSVQNGEDREGSLQKASLPFKSNTLLTIVANPTFGLQKERRHFAPLFH
jgi:hypothetical protein